MSLVPLPNAEQLVSQFLRTNPDVMEIFADNIFTDLPAGYSGPWPAARLTRVGGAPVFSPAVLDLPLIQIDVWGGPKITAEKGAAIIRAALDQALPWTYEGFGTLGGVNGRLGSLHYLPDSTFDPARPRYVFDAPLVTRPWIA